MLEPNFEKADGLGINLFCKESSEMVYSSIVMLGGLQSSNPGVENYQDCITKINIRTVKSQVLMRVTAN